MNFTLDHKSLEQAFQARPDIQEAIKRASSTPPLIELFNEISRHVCTVINTLSDEPASKRRRIDEPPTNKPAAANGIPIHPQAASSNGSSVTGPSITILDPTILLEIKDISVVVPQRKKYTLCFTPTHLYARLPDSKDPAPGISYAWNDIEHIFCLPVPEKAQKQYNYILFPRDSNLPPPKPTPGSQPLPEPLVFTISDSAPKPGSISGTDAAAASAVSDDYKTLLHWAITTRLSGAHNHAKITEADPSLFASTLRQPQRPSEKAVHVKAFRGSKDGYLFFLPTGILWGFKKPLLFLPHSRIAAVSYTSVLQRTFNLTVEADMSPSSPSSNGAAEEKEEEIEFAMLDQDDFAAIDEYVKRHGLQDRSMAEQRRAKRLNVNVVKDEDGNVVGNAEAGELERAALEAQQLKKQKQQGGAGQQASSLQQLQGKVFSINMDEDEDDEDEEDYDPGSEGESEGEGDSSEEDDDDDDDDEEEDAEDDEDEGGGEE
ncbi:putative chaperone protein [Xylogone sp. PMI_703]|nr:putative chaperone protein [Xylogone sp. PMI_703]